MHVIEHWVLHFFTCEHSFNLDIWYNIPMHYVCREISSFHQHAMWLFMWHESTSVTCIICLCQNLFEYRKRFLYCFIETVLLRYSNIEIDYEGNKVNKKILSEYSNTLVYTIRSATLWVVRASMFPSCDISVSRPFVQKLCVVWWSRHDHRNSSVIKLKLMIDLEIIR